MPSYIEFEKLASLPAASDISRVVFGITDNGAISISNESGSAIGGSIVTINPNAFFQMRDMGTLVPGTLYYLEGADQNYLYGGTDIILLATSTSSFNPRGVGKFYNPQYDQTETGFGIWTNLIKFSTNNLSGSFQYNEEYYGNPGNILAYDPLDITQHIVFNTDFDGGYNYLVPDNSTDDWSVVTSITGSSSGATIQVTGITAPSYASGSKVIWGGKVWVNKTGEVGTQNGPFDLDGTNWEVVEYNDIDYNVVWDAIEYDVENDFITMRKDSAGNIVEQSYNDWLDWDGYRAIKTFQWGNQWNEDENCGIGQNRVNNSIFFIVNFRGRRCLNNEIKNYSYVGGDCYFEDDVRFSENIISDSGLFICFFSGNNCYFSNNIINDCWIGFNYLAGDIIITDNTFTNSQLYNNSLVYTDIYSNTLIDSSIYDTFAQYSCGVRNNFLNDSYIGGNGGGNYLTYYCSIDNNTLSNGSYISGINVTNNSNIDRNNLSSNSYITGITADNGDITYNNLVANSYIQNNTISLDSGIWYNTLSSEAEIYGNVVVSSSYIEYNSVNASTIDNNNTISGSISIYANVLYNNSHIRNNIMDYDQEISNNAFFNSSALENQTISTTNTTFLITP